MASPQLETGFLRLSNELAEAIARAPMNGAQHRIVMVVLRECFGRNGGRKVAPLSLRKIAGRTGLSLRWVRRESSRLLRAGVIVRLPGRGLDLYGIVKDYDQWKLQRISQGTEKQKEEGQSAPRGQFAPGEGVNQPPKGRVNRPPRIKKEESLKNISSKPSGSDGSVPPSGNQKAEIKATIRQLWDYYIAKLGKNPKLLTLTALREQKGRSRLEECLRKTGEDLAKAEELMQIAIDALAASEFHRGGNKEKKRYDSWEKNLFPSQEKLEWWLERAQC